MADDVNKSKGSPMNGGFGLSEIDKIGREAYTIPLAEQEQRSRAIKARTQIESLSQYDPQIIASSKVLSRIMSTAPNTLMSAQDYIKHSVGSRLERHNVQAANAVGREYSERAVNSMVSQMSGSTVHQNTALTMMNTPYESLEARQRDIQGQISGYGTGAQGAARNLFGSRGMNRTNMEAISGYGQQAMAGVQELTGIELAMKAQRKMGLDPLSRFERLNTSGASANETLSSAALSKELSGGGVNINRGGNQVSIASGDINKAVIVEAERLKKALTELATTTETNTETLDKMRRSAEETADNFEKLKKAQGEGGGGGRNNLIGNLNTAAGAFGAVGGAAQQILVSQRMQQIANTAGFAGMANQQYDMYTAARGGDIASQLALGQFSDADQFGMEMKRGTNIVQGAYAAGAGAQTGAGIVQVGTTLNPAENALSTSQAQANRQTGILNTVQGASNLAVIASDVEKGASAQAARLAGAQAQIQARQAVNYVGAKQAQGLRNFYTDMDVVAQGMGTGAGAFLTNATSDENLSAMSAARLSPEQFAKLSHTGLENMGSTFNTGQVFAARNMERAGFGSADRNLQRMGALASAGANQPQAGMETLLSAAVAAGLDRSKGLDALVQNTAAMVQTSAGAAVGLDTTNASASMLLGGMNMNMENREAALQQAASAAELTRLQTTDASATFTGMVNTAGVQTATGLTGADAILAQGMDIQTLKTLQKDPAKASAFFENQGINTYKGSVQDFTSKMLREKQKQILRSGPGMSFINNPNEYIDIIEGAGSEEAAVSALQKSGKFNNLADAAGFQKRKGGAREIIREVLGTTSPNVSPGAGETITGGTGATDLKTQLDALRTSGFKQAAEAAEFASTKLKDFGGALKVFTDLTNKFEKDGPANEKAFSEAAANMAKDFTISIGKFDTATSKYEEASKAMMKAAGLWSNANPVVPNAMSDLLNEQKSSSRGN